MKPQRYHVNPAVQKWEEQNYQKLMERKVKGARSTLAGVIRAQGSNGAKGQGGSSTTSTVCSSSVQSCRPSDTDSSHRPAGGKPASSDLDTRLQQLLGLPLMQQLLVAKQQQLPGEASRAASGSAPERRATGSDLLQLSAAASAVQGAALHHLGEQNKRGSRAPVLSQAASARTSDAADRASKYEGVSSAGAAAAALDTVRSIDAPQAKGTKKQARGTSRTKAPASKPVRRKPRPEWCDDWSAPASTSATKAASTDTGVSERRARATSTDTTSPSTPRKVVNTADKHSPAKPVPLTGAATRPAATPPARHRTPPAEVTAWDSRPLQSSLPAPLHHRYDRSPSPVTRTAGTGRSSSGDSGNDAASRQPDNTGLTVLRASLQQLTALVDQQITQQQQQQQQRHQPGQAHWQSSLADGRAMLRGSTLSRQLSVNLIGGDLSLQASEQLLYAGLGQSDLQFLQQMRASIRPPPATDTDAGCITTTQVAGGRRPTSDGASSNRSSSGGIEPQQLPATSQLCCSSFRASNSSSSSSNPPQGAAGAAAPELQGSLAHRGSSTRAGIATVVEEEDDLVELGDTFNNCRADELRAMVAQLHPPRSSNSDPAPCLSPGNITQRLMLRTAGATTAGSMPSAASTVGSTPPRATSSRSSHAGADQQPQQTSGPYSSVSSRGSARSVTGSGLLQQYSSLPLLVPCGALSAQTSALLGGTEPACGSDTAAGNPVTGYTATSSADASPGSSDRDKQGVDAKHKADAAGVTPGNRGDQVPAAGTGASHEGDDQDKSSSGSSSSWQKQHGEEGSPHTQGHQEGATLGEVQQVLQEANHLWDRLQQLGYFMA